MEEMARLIAQIVMMVMWVHTCLPIHHVVCINYGQVFVCLRIRSQRQRQGHFLLQKIWREQRLAFKCDLSSH